MSFVIAIDGPAGAGKGTIAKLVGEKLNLVKIDTGATYRCVALNMINKGVKLEDEPKIKEILDKINIEINTRGEIFLNKENVTDRIRQNDVNDLVSPVSAIPIVRKKLVDIQRKIAEGKNVIMEGRDIGTVVFPNANVKIYLDATAEERAKRRVLQNEEKGIQMSYEEILENIKMRDKNDKEKEFGALKVAPGATVIDTTNMTIKQVEQEISKIIDKKLKQKKKEAKIYAVRPETTWKKIERAVIKKLIYWFYRILFRIEKINEENIPLDEPCIVCANHINYWDAVGLVVTSKRRIRFIAKEDLFNNGFLNWIAHVFDVIPIKRGMRDLDSMKTCLKALKNGETLGIFPEGTRKGLAKGAKVQNGAAYMAIKTKVKVVPVGIQGNFKPFTKVKLNYGKPLDFTKLDSKNPEKDNLEQATKEIMDNIVMLTKQEK